MPRSPVALTALLMIPGGYRRACNRTRLFDSLPKPWDVRHVNHSRLEIDVAPRLPSPPTLPTLPLSSPAHNLFSTNTLGARMATNTSRLRHATAHLHHLPHPVPRLQLSRPVQYTWGVLRTYLASAQWILRTRQKTN